MVRKAKREGADIDIDQSEVLDMYSELESLVKINSVSLTREDRLSTGLLGLDLILGGGISPAMTTFSGPEQSAKTTAAITVMGANATNKDIKFKVLWDAENSTGSSTDYVANIFETMGNKVDVQDLFGVKKDGQYAVPPLVYYRDDYEGDKFFNWLHALQKRLPDKRFDSGRWWYVYERTKENISKFAGKGDKGMGSKNPGIWIPAKDGSLQALIILDSYPSLVPSAMDEEEGSNAMAVQARMFSKHLPRVKGAFRAKRIALLGINQLRLNPGVRYGCLHGSVVIPFVDGTSHTMREIVENKIRGKVWSYNEETKAIEPREIVDWHYNGEVESDADWIDVTFQEGRISVTHDHEILTETGWKKAKDLTLLDKLATSAIGLVTAGLATFTQVLEITRGVGHMFRTKGKYDISVQGNHNYLAGNPASGAIVHNSPEYEPGGQSLAFFSDVRVRLYPRVTGMPYNPKFESGFETEPSVTGEGVDTYRYVLAKAIKNKLSVPNRTSWLRVWVSDSEGNARGYDPVWDSLFYLNQTGQITGVRKKLMLNLHGLGEAKRAITYEEFKVLILGTKEQWEPIFNKLGYKTLALRKGLFNQMKKGTAEELYITNRNAKSKSNEEDDDDE